MLCLLSCNYVFVQLYSSIKSGSAPAVSSEKKGPVYKSEKSDPAIPIVCYLLSDISQLIL